MALVNQKAGFNLKSSIGLKAIIVVAIVGIAHQYYIMEFPDDEEMTIATFSLSISSAAAAITSFAVSKRYWGSEVFGKTYLALAISFCFVLAGDLTYIYYDWYTEEAPYPSIADVFFLLFYPFASLSLKCVVRSKICYPSNFIKSLNSWQCSRPCRKLAKY